MKSNKGAPNVVPTGTFRAVAPVVADGQTAVYRIDNDAILFVKNVGGGGAAYPTGQEAPIAAATWALILNTLPVAIFRAAPPVLLDGQGSALRIDATGRLLVSTAGTPVSRYSSAGDAISGLIGPAGVRQLLQIKNHNAQPGPTRYLQLFDAIALPINGTVPYWTATETPPGSDASESFGEEGLPFAIGAFWASSSTRTTLTVVVVADMNVSARFR